MVASIYKKLFFSFLTNFLVIIKNRFLFSLNSVKIFYIVEFFLHPEYA